MNVKDQYDSLIHHIENNSSLDGDSLLSQLRSMSALNNNNLAAVMGFMTGLPLMKYVKTRRMMKVYQDILQSQERPRAIELAGEAGFSDEPGFDKAFKKQFGCTASEAWARKDASLYQPPQYWDTIATGKPVEVHVEQEVLQQEKKDEPLQQPSQHLDADIIEDPAKDHTQQRAPKEKTLFGIPVSLLNVAKKAQGLADLYGFDQEASEAAYQIYKEYNIPLKKTFAFVDEYSIYWSGYGVGNVAYHTNLIYLYFTFNLSVSESIDLIFELQRQGYEDLRSIPLEVMEAYLIVDASMARCMELYELYKTCPNPDDDFSEFADDVFNQGTDPEEAYALLTLSSDILCEDDSSYYAEEAEEYLGAPLCWDETDLEKWQEEHGEDDSDSDFDPDNYNPYGYSSDEDGSMYLWD